MKKKAAQAPKLTLNRESLLRLQPRDVQGGVAQQSRLDDTVYRPGPTEYQCPTMGCGVA